MRFFHIWDGIVVSRVCWTECAGSSGDSLRKANLVLACAALLGACEEVPDGPHRDADGRVQIFGPETRLPADGGLDDDSGSSDTVFTVPGQLDAGHGEFGSTVKLFVDFRDPARNTSCTGVLLGRAGTQEAGYVLTAAHCLDRRRVRNGSASPITRLVVSYGFSDTSQLRKQALTLGDENDWIAGASIMGAAFQCHEEYPSDKTRDLCLLKLAEPLPTTGSCADGQDPPPCIRVARLPEAGDFAKGDSRMERMLSGFGNTVRDAARDCSAFQPARVLRFAEVRPDVALPGTDATFEVNGSHRAATCVPDKPCAAICAGDSGGGLFLYPEREFYDDHVVLGIGIASFGETLDVCAPCLDPDARTTFVSVLANRDWIEDTMTLLDERAL